MAETPDIIIRRAEPNDAARMIALVQGICEEPDVDVPIGPGEFTITEEQERQMLTDVAASDNSAFFVAEAADEIVGVLNLNGGKRKALRHAAQLGISIRRDWRRRGVGTLLMRAAIDWARGTGVITRIELRVYARNLAGRELYEKFGFVAEGACRGAIFQRGEYLDDLIMALLL
jgi:RimJ/RimL family protein N-acetyltransferase